MEAATNHRCYPPTHRCSNLSLPNADFVKIPYLKAGSESPHISGIVHCFLGAYPWVCVHIPAQMVHLRTSKSIAFHIPYLLVWKKSLETRPLNALHKTWRSVCMIWMLASFHFCCYCCSAFSTLNPMCRLNLQNPSGGSKQIPVLPSQGDAPTRLLCKSIPIAWWERQQKLRLSDRMGTQRQLSKPGELKSMLPSLKSLVSLDSVHPFTSHNVFDLLGKVKLLNLDSLLARHG